MGSDKTFQRSEKDAIRLQLLASMLVTTNAHRQKQPPAFWHSCWQGLRRMVKQLQ